MVDRVRPLFPLGQCVATPEPWRHWKKQRETPADFLNRHVFGDWGEIHPADRGLNEQTLGTVPAYSAFTERPKEQRFGSSPRPICSSTCILLPDEY